MHSLTEQPPAGGNVAGIHRPDIGRNLGNGRQPADRPDGTDHRDWIAAGGGASPPRHRANGDAVVIDGLSKRYGQRAAVDNLSFTVPAGSVAGLIGPNGAGKTTLMAILLGLVHPSAGTGTVLGQRLDQPARYVGRVGGLIEGPAFHPGVSGIDNLRSLAVLGGHDQEPIPSLIDLVGLTGRGDDKYSSYSMGMKQRLGIAAALLGDPELVILDEPTNGLDPVGMQDIRRLIGEIADGGRTVIVSSHLLGELEQVCDWLIVIDRGGLKYLGAPEQLAGTEALVLRTADPAHLPVLRSMVASTGLPTDITDGELVVTLTLPAAGDRHAAQDGAGPGYGDDRGDDPVDPAALAAEINRRAHAAGIVLSELHHRRADLEARYLDLVSRDDAGSSSTAITDPPSPPPRPTTSRDGVSP